MFARLSSGRGAISMVMAGGVLAAILGPNLAIWSRQWYDGNAFVGAFYGLFIIYVLALLLISILPLAVPLKITTQQVTRSYRELFRQPLLIAAMASGAIGYAVMVLLMTATPIAMQHDDFPFSNIAWVIQWHVLGHVCAVIFYRPLDSSLQLAPSHSLGLRGVGAVCAGKCTGQ